MKPTGSFHRGADGPYGLLMYAQAGRFASAEVAFGNLFAEISSTAEQARTEFAELRGQIELVGPRA